MNDFLRRSIASTLLILAVACGRSGDEGGTVYPLELESQLIPARVEDISALPDTGLVDQDGAPFTFDALVGRRLLISALYTSCPMPEMCPLLASRIADVQAQLRAEHPDGSFAFVLISFDPEVDTPEVFRQFAQDRGLELDNMVLVTGEPSTIEDLMKQLGIVVGPRHGTMITHNMLTYLVDARGVIRSCFRQSSWDPGHVAARLSQL